MKRDHAFEKLQTEILQVFQYVLWYAVCQKTKTRKRRKSIVNFVKQKIPIGNICNYQETAKEQTICYGSAIFASQMSKTTFRVLFLFLTSNFEQ